MEGGRRPTAAYIPYISTGCLEQLARGEA